MEARRYGGYIHHVWINRMDIPFVASPTDGVLPDAQLPGIVPHCLIVLIELFLGICDEIINHVQALYRLIGHFEHTAVQVGEPFLYVCHQLAPGSRDTLVLPLFYVDVHAPGLRGPTGL